MRRHQDNEYLSKLKQECQVMINSNNATIMKLKRQSEHLKSQFSIVLQMFNQTTDQNSSPPKYYTDQIQFRTPITWQSSKKNENQTNYKQENQNQFKAIKKSQNIIQQEYTLPSQIDLKLASDQTQKFSKIAKQQNQSECEQSQKGQEILGNSSIQQRLISEFFQKYFLDQIEFTNDQKDSISKKQILKAYIQWRIQKMPEQKFNLPAIQMAITSHLTKNYIGKCTQRKGSFYKMKFKEVEFIRKLIRFKIQNYQIKKTIVRKKKMKVQNKKLMNFDYQKQGFDDFSKLESGNINNDSIVSDE